MSDDRDLTWDGMVNVRDLGGLVTRDGGVTVRGAVVRSDTPELLTPTGWDALVAYDIHTIVRLATASVDPEDDPADPDRPPHLTSIRVDVEDGDDADFADRWAATNLWATPLYYADAIERWPERCAAAVQAVAHAGPGGVLVHCHQGCDRTGLVSMLLLALIHVEPTAIAADYARSAERLGEDEPYYAEWLAETMAEHGTTTTEVIEATVGNVDIEGILRAGGLTDADLRALRRRLLNQG